MKNILEFQNFKIKKQPITMVTCYDASFARLVEKSNVDVILIGDSVAQVIHGHDTTLAATVGMMVLHTKAVRRGSPSKFIVTDMPFLSTRKGLKTAMEAAHKLMVAGAQALKIEGAKGHLELIRHLVDSGIPVMGHLGLTPQSIHQLGGPKIQGRSEDQAVEILQEALALEKAGCFSLVLECVPWKLAKSISEKLSIPTIGIGAGIHCDGQVLVLQDMLGMNSDFNPKFLKKYSDIETKTITSLNQYADEVQKKAFPTPENSYE